MIRALLICDQRFGGSEDFSKSHEHRNETQSASLCSCLATCFPVYQGKQDPRGSEVCCAEQVQNQPFA